MNSVKLMTLPEQIAERIFAAIADGAYAPGDRIREEALAEQFAVSRGPVREALRILEKDAVVCILPHRGAHVTQLSRKEVGDIFEIRGKLVAAMARTLDFHDEKFCAHLDGKVAELEGLARQAGAKDRYLAASYELGCELADNCGNERLAQILASLARQTRRYSRLGLGTAARRRESARSWRAMADAVKAGDRDRAAAALEALITSSGREAARQLEASNSQTRRPGRAAVPAAGMQTPQELFQ